MMGDLVPTFCIFYFTAALVVDLRSQNPLQDYAIEMSVLCIALRSVTGSPEEVGSNING
ncbi:hypothetical protein [Varibaculum cambriense]|uniref:hypothetical protein n=1 Tax=Varibaculum cambriense TaxID=184870 RepID=UPI0003FA44B5|nr:hypothetical protein [Varibaculum cambriense]MBS6619879.1 hypothetical protein [Varibaculum cambriense]